MIGNSRLLRGEERLRPVSRPTNLSVATHVCMDVGSFSSVRSPSPKVVMVAPVWKEDMAGRVTRVIAVTIIHVLYYETKIVMCERISLEFLSRVFPLALRDS